MKLSLIVTATALVLGFSNAALAQAKDEHQGHHPDGSAPQTQPAPAPAQPPAVAPPAQQGQPMPQQCQSMMQNMQTCMGMMRQMMHGRAEGGTGSGMMAGGMMGGMGRQGAQAAGTTAHPAASPATKAYLEAAEKMHAPMMEGVQANDPDVAFVRGMIPHHQAAIDMARVVMQYGKDAQTQNLAEAIVREQEREIGVMREWLKQNSR